MEERNELMEAALESFPEGIALLGKDGQVHYWNRAAEEISGFPRIEVVGRPTPWALEPLLHEEARDGVQPAESAAGGTRVEVRHKLGAAYHALVRHRVLRDALGARIGSVAAFHATERNQALPHGATTVETEAGESQTSFEERLEEEFAEWQLGEGPFGLLWVAVDQAHELRQTHGRRACEAMLQCVEQTLTNGMRGHDQMGRWGDDEFLVLAHAATREKLGALGQVLAGLARTSDFRWWGDRLSVTVSMGAAQAEEEDKLVDLLERAQAAMSRSVHAGGNQITVAPGRHMCSQS